jgi:hypothetical protein
LALVLAVAACGARSSAPATVAVTAGADLTLEARLLLVGVDGTEPALAAFQRELDYIGTPYTVVTTATGPVTSAMLSDGGAQGLYDGVVLAACGAGAGPDAASVAALDAYAAAFGVREACLFARADPAYGFGPGTSVDTRAAPITLAFTPDGQAVFGWYAAPAPFEVSGVNAVLAPAAGAGTRPLLTDGAGNAAVAVHQFADGRELMLLTFDHAPGARHSSQLLCGVASWVQRGVFIGEKRAYFTPQPDDLFLGTLMQDGTIYRMSGDDLRNAAQWQQQVRSMPVGAQLRVVFPFTGSEVADSDGLTQAALSVGSQFAFVSHTLDHHRLDYADYARMTQELTGADAIMQKYMFGPYDRTSLVTPDVSGLANAGVLQAALDFGIQRLVCDATMPSCQPAVPNTGLANPTKPAMFMIPRLATNLYANVSTPTEWLASYNAAYHGVWGRDLSLDEIMDRESDTLLGHLLDGDIRPVMFHQANLRMNDGTHTLLTDLLDHLIAKYAALRTLPIVSLQMDEMGSRMVERGRRDAAGVAATIRPGQSITVRATQAAHVPVTGSAAPDAEVYGTVTISRVNVPAGGQVTLPLPPPAGAASADAGPDGPPAATSSVAATTGAAAPSGCSCAVARGRPMHGARGALVAAATTALATMALAIRRRRRRAARASLG